MAAMSGVEINQGLPIEADSALSECDSVCTDFESIASTIPNFVYENGRRYHARYADRYFLPNDEREQERLDFFHHIFRLTLNGELCYSTLENPQRILDIGTGTGIWAIEMANTFPNAEVVGTDLSPIQPGWTPDNVTFTVDDAIQEWGFPDSSFDFIHVRTLGGSIPDWSFLLKQCYRRLRPGGQLEVSEARTHMWCDDGTLPQDSYTKYWEKEFYRLCETCGCEFDIFPKLAGWMQDAGFDDVDTEEKIVPVGTWPKDKMLKMKGRYLQAAFLGTGLEAYSIAVFSRGGGWKSEDVRALLDKVTQEILTNKMHIYTRFSFAVARKPVDG